MPRLALDVLEASRLPAGRTSNGSTTIFPPAAATFFEVSISRASPSSTGPAVDFRVPDADAATDKAKKLGGRVVAGPFDIPRFRQAVLADPKGAVFSVSSLKRKG